MKTSYMIVSKETGLSVRSFPTAKEAKQYAAEMADYHQKAYKVEERKVPETLRDLMTLHGGPAFLDRQITVNGRPMKVVVGEDRTINFSEAF